MQRLATFSSSKAVILGLLLLTYTFNFIDRTIIGMIVQQALALGLIGFSIGATLIFNIKDHFPRRVVLEPDNVLALGLIVFVVCLLASSLGVRAALKIDPATALGS